jgi:hypothetical protein
MMSVVMLMAFILSVVAPFLNNAHCLDNNMVHPELNATEPNTFYSLNLIYFVFCLAGLR